MDEINKLYYFSKHDLQKATFSDVSALVEVYLVELLPDEGVAVPVQAAPELGELPEVDALVAVLVGGVDQRPSLRVRHLPAHLDQSEVSTGVT